MSDQEGKILVLGAGPSGLGVAWGLVERGHRNVVIVEKSDRVGGLAGSVTRGALTFDLGPHRLSPEYPDVVHRLRSLLGEELEELPNEQAVMFRGYMYRYPPRLTEVAHPRSLLPALRFAGSWLSAAGKRLGPGRNDSPTLPAILARRFGRQFYDEVFSPMCHKVWGDPERLDASFATLRFSLPSMAKVATTLWRSAAINDRTYHYPRRGFQQIWNAIAAHLTREGVDIRCGTTVSTLERKDGGITAATLLSSHRTQKLDVAWLVSTIAPEPLLSLLPEIPCPPLLRGSANRGLALVAFLIKRDRTLPARVVIFPESEYSFSRLSEQNQFSAQTVPQGRSLVTADILCPEESEPWRTSDETLIRRVQAEVTKSGLWSAHEVEEAHVLRVPYAYPVPLRGREEAQRQLMSELAGYRNLLCTGRFATSDYNNSHTALKKGLTAARYVAEQLPVEEWYAQSDVLRQVPIRD